MAVIADAGLLGSPLAVLADAAAVTWPLAMTVASVAVAERVRSGRRRRALNRALHELRRPLQALVLAQSSASARSRTRAGDHAVLALDALADLDRQVNGAGAAPLRRPQEARALAIAAVERWRWQAALAGRRVELAWRAGSAMVVCDPGAIGRALDNLIANALEHGGAWVRIEGSVRSDRLRLGVADGHASGRPGEPAPSAGPLVRAARRPWHTGGFRHRGHGLGIVAAIAAEHAGRFAICRHEGGASAVLELPLARPAPTSAR
jgi:signal transduction histidine kinase